MAWYLFHAYQIHLVFLLRICGCQMVVVIPTNSLQQLLNKNYVNGHTSSSRIGRIRRSHCRTLEDNSVSTAYVMADSNVFSYNKLCSYLKHAYNVIFT